MDTKGKRIILGSNSPRRRELLAGLDIDFIVDTGNDFEETYDPSTPHEMIPEILSDCGEQGLKGAMDRCSMPVYRIDVDDFGTVLDADTPEDFSALVAYHNAQLVRPVVSVSLAKEKPFFDSKMAMLLMLILPPPYVIPVFADEPKERGQIASALSALTLVTMILFAGLSVVFNA